jgi:hypothetical protein
MEIVAAQHQKDKQTSKKRKELKDDRKVHRKEVEGRRFVFKTQDEEKRKPVGRVGGDVNTAARAARIHIHHHTPMSTTTAKTVVV